MKLAATVKDTECEYIGTFITFLERIVGIMGTLMDKMIDALGKLSALGKKED